MTDRLERISESKPSQIYNNVDYFKNLGLQSATRETHSALLMSCCSYPVP